MLRGRLHNLRLLRSILAQTIAAIDLGSLSWQANRLKTSRASSENLLRFAE